MTVRESAPVVAGNTRPLIVRLGALGDMVITTVLIRHLAERFGQPVDIVSSGGWTKPLLDGQPGVGELYLLNSRRWPYWLSGDQQRLVSQLRARGQGPTWLCDHDNAKNRRLLERAGWRADHLVEVNSLYGIGGPHMCELYLRFAYRNPAIAGGGDAPCTATDSYGRLTVSDSMRSQLDAWLTTRELLGTPLILVQPGNKRTMRRGGRRRDSNSKYWPEANWAQTLRGIRELHPEHAILMLGVPAEAALNDEILQLAKIERAFNVAHELPLPRLMALAERAFGMISVDTGPAHLAASVGCAVVTLFGKANPEWYAPRGPDARVTCLTGVYDGEQSMLGITPDAVLDAWRALHRAY